MRILAVLLLCVLLPSTSIAADAGYRVSYDGGSVSDLKTGSNLRLQFDQTSIHLMKGNENVLSVPVSAVTEISYGQDVHRRVGAAIGLAVVSFGIGALMALSKSKKHFIGITWDDASKKGGFVIQCDKSDYRGVLAGLEGVTGKKAVDSEAMTVRN